MQKRLKRLSFGNDRASVFDSEDAFGAALRRMKRPIGDFSFSGTQHRASAFAVRIGELVLSTAQSEPMHAKCMVDPQLSFVVPVSGSGRIVGGGKFVEWMTTRLIISNSYDRPLEFITEANAIITLRPSTAKFRDTLESALRDRSGPDAKGVDDLLAKLLERGPFIDPGRSWSVDYHAAIMRIAELADDCNCDEALLSRIGIEDVVNRLLAQLVLEQEQVPEAETAEVVQAASRSIKAVDLICDHIRGSIGAPLSIPQMEGLTGLTGRALNYAFQARFGCSPQEWQRGFLLDHARPILMDPDYTGSVKALAYELGFASPSSFAAFYRQRFGELPSETLAGASRTKAPPRPLD